MFSLDMMPAAYGDALWIEYGDSAAPRRILIDGGKLSSAEPIARRIREVAASNPTGLCSFELAVLTHIDGDHIEGFLSLIHSMSAGTLPMRVGEIWFNGAPHLPDPHESSEPAPPGSAGAPSFGALQGEMLSFVLFDQKLPWNVWSSMGPIFIPQRGRLPVFELPGGMKLTLLGPTFERLQKLRAKWDKEVKEWEKKSKAKLSPETVVELLADRPEGRVLHFAEEEGLDVRALADAWDKEDTSEPNGSSIALLAEYEGKSILLLGDAFARDMASAIRRLLTERAPKGGAPKDKLRVNALKVAHHGSRNNISEELLSLVDCDHFLISTNGAVFGHPDPEAVAQMVGGKHRFESKSAMARLRHLYFNYRSPQTTPWEGKDIEGNMLSDVYQFRAHYPEKGKEGLKVVLSA